MIRTLQTYIAKDLLKTAVLSLVAFTLVMTVLAIVDPLRKRGLSGEQVIALVGYTVPFMLSLTLPIAALFAATVVYGRFSQDNELLACRASGIPTLSIMRPALVLGALVTIASLALSNFVSPHMARMSELAIKANVRGIIYHEISSQGRWRWGAHTVHADSIEQVGDTLILEGVVYAEQKLKKKIAAKPAGADARPAPKAKDDGLANRFSGTSNIEDVRILSAARAVVYFTTLENETYVTIDLDRPVITQTSEQWVASEASQPIDSIQLPNPAKEKAAFYDWDKLVAMLKSPVDHREIRETLEGIRRKLRHDMFARQLVGAIAAGQPYGRLSNMHNTFQVKAASAIIESPEIVALYGTKDRPVEITVLRDGVPAQTVTAESATVEMTWVPHLDVSQASIRLKDSFGVMIRHANGGEQRREDWVVGQLSIPQDIVDRSDRVQVSDVFHNIEQLTDNPTILAQVNDLKTKRMGKVVGDITAEIHGRVAYGVSCFLMVAMGAALGLIYRGGQVITAFAISIVPAAIVIVLMLMGKELVGNPKVAHGMLWGLMSIWSGVVILTVANVVIYARLARR